MSQGRVGQVLPLLMVLMLVWSPIAIAAGTVSASTTQSENTYSITDQIDVWERSPLSFEVESSSEKTINKGSTIVNLQEAGTGDVPIKDGGVSVYQPNVTVNTLFNSKMGVPTGEFNGNDTQVVVARLEPDTPENAGMEMLPTSLSEMKELFTSEDANQNATFWVENGSEIENGSVAPEITFPKSGTYAVFLATGSAFETSNNGDNLSVTGDTTIIGLDAALVEKGEADVSVDSQSVTPGDSANFTVNTDTNVSVFLYNSSTVEKSQTEFIVTGPINSSLNASDLTIRHSISDINGQVELEGAVPFLDSTLNDKHVSGSISVAGIIKRAVDEANNREDKTGQTVEHPETEVLKQDASGNAFENTLNASVVTATDVDSGTTIHVQTLESWSEGNYSYIITTGGNTPGDIRTKIGELNLTKSGNNSDNNGGGPGGGETPPSDGGGNGDNNGGGVSPGGGTGGGDETPPSDGGGVDTPRVEGAGAGSSVEARNGRVNVSLSGTTPGQSVRVQVPVNESDLERDGHAVNGMNLNFSRNSSGTINVAPTTEPDAPPVSSEGDLGYFEITHSMEDDDVESATYEFSVSKQRLEQRGLGSDEVALHRYEGDAWRELETRTIGETNTAYQYEADSPGLSLYAISQRSQASFEVTSADVTPSEVAIGGSVDVTATIENQGSAAGEFTAQLEVDGTVVDSITVELDAGEQTSVEFTRSFDEAGDYTVSVSGVEAGSVSVTSQTTTTTTTAAPGGEDDGGISPIIWVGILLIVAAIGAGIYLYREGYFENDTSEF